MDPFDSHWLVGVRHSPRHSSKMSQYLDLEAILAEDESNPEESATAVKEDQPDSDDVDGSGDDTVCRRCNEVIEENCVCKEPVSQSDDDVDEEKDAHQNPYHTNSPPPPPPFTLPRTARAHEEERNSSPVRPRKPMKERERDYDYSSTVRRRRYGS